MARFRPKREHPYEAPRHAKRASNASWDAATMLRKAIRGAYPSAEYGKSRDREIAYWRARCEAEGIDPAPIMAVTRYQRRRSYE